MRPNGTGGLFYVHLAVGGRGCLGLLCSRRGRRLLFGARLVDYWVHRWVKCLQKHMLYYRSRATNNILGLSITLSSSMSCRLTRISFLWQGNRIKFFNSEEERLKSSIVQLTCVHWPPWSCPSIFLIPVWTLISDKIIILCVNCTNKSIWLYTRDEKSRSSVNQVWITTCKDLNIVNIHCILEKGWVIVTCIFIMFANYIQ